MQALGSMWEERVARLIKPMLLTGLSARLIQALVKISKHLPSTLPAVQQHLLLPVLAALPMPPADSASVGSSQWAASWRPCYHVRPSLLRAAGMEEFAKQVQRQVRAPSGSRVHRVIVNIEDYFPGLN